MVLWQVLKSGLLVGTGQFLKLVLECQAKWGEEHKQVLINKLLVLIGKLFGWFVVLSKNAYMLEQTTK